MQSSRPSAALVAAVPVYFYLFDLIWFDGYDLLGAAPGRSNPSCTTRSFEDPIHAIRGTSKRTERSRSAPLARRGGRGSSPSAAAPYTHARSNDWLRIQVRERAGVRRRRLDRAHGSRSGLGALLVGYHELASYGSAEGRGPASASASSPCSRASRPARTGDSVDRRNERTDHEGACIGSNRGWSPRSTSAVEPRRQAATSALSRSSRRQAAGAGRPRAT